LATGSFFLLLPGAAARPIGKSQSKVKKKINVNVYFLFRPAKTG
jgi:hypothetical protein